MKAKYTAIYLQKDTSGLLLKKSILFNTKFTNENVLAYDSTDRLIFRSSSSPWIVNYSVISEIKKKNITNFNIYKSAAVGYHFIGPIRTINVIVAANDVYGTELQKKLRNVLLALFLISIPLIILLGKVIANKMIKPVEFINKALQEIEKGNFNENNLDRDLKEELLGVTRRIKLMADKVKYANHAQKLFISNASHELRTPLTIISGQLEVLLMNERTPDEYRTAIANNLHDIQELINIYNQLLILAHASSDFSDIFKTELRIDEIIWSAREELIKAYPHYKVIVKFSDNIREDSQFVILGNELLLLSALSNLMENGCKFSDNKTVTVFIETNNQTLSLRFTDTGKGIEKNDVAFIFEPFYKGNSVGSKGKGIGLSIARKVIELHYGTIEIISAIQKGTEINITLPLAISQPG